MVIFTTISFSFAEALFFFMESDQVCAMCSVYAIWSMSICLRFDTSAIITCTVMALQMFIRLFYVPNRLMIKPT